MDLSILIPVFNKAGLTRVCLTALQQTLPADLKWEVIVVDNNSTDDTPAALAEFPWIRLITNKENLGFAAANNQAARAASGKHLLLLNNDTEPTGAWVRHLLAAAEEESNAGAIGTRLLFANRTLQHAGVVVSSERFGPYHFTPYHYLWSDAGERPAAMVRRDFQIVTGACLMTLRALYLSLGGLDEAFWNGYEDVDYCFKVLDAGKRVVYEPKPEIFHYESQSGPMRFSRVAYNSSLLAQRWATFPRIDHNQKYLAAGNIRRKNRIANKFATASMVCPPTTVLVHGDVQPDVEALAERLCNTLAPIERVLWHPPSAPPRFQNVPVVRTAGSAVDALRSEMEVRGDRYVAIVDAAALLEPNWLDKLIEQIEFGSDVVAATAGQGGCEVSLAATAGCTLLALRFFPQHETLAPMDTLDGAVADLTLRMLPYEFGVRQAREVTRELPAVGADASFERLYGAPVASFLRDDPDYVETRLRERVPRAVESLKASVVMLSWNAPQYTKIALESIRAHTKMPYEVIIVDNGSGAETTEFLKTQDDIIVVYNEKNRGFAAGCNQGIGVATGDYVVLLNNDVVVTDGWLENLVEAVERDPSTGVSAPRSNEIAGDQRLLDLNYKTIEEMHAIAARRTAEHRRSGYFTDRAIGFCLCISRNVIEQVGGIDENYGTGNFEDDDFCMRVRAAGYRIYVCNDVFIHHFGSVSFQTNSVDYAATMYRNWEKFARKWGYDTKFPSEGYNAQLAIRSGFDRAKHYVTVPTPAVLAPPAAREGEVGVLFGAAVRSERDWEAAGNAVRRYLKAFTAGDDVSFAIACAGETDAATIGGRVAKAMDKDGIDPERSADVLIVDDRDPEQFLAAVPARRRFSVPGRQTIDGFESLTAWSPSDLRRLYAGLNSGARE